MIWDYITNSQWRVDLHARLTRSFLCLVEGLCSPWPSRCCAKLPRWYQQLGDPWVWAWTLMAVCVRLMWVSCFVTAGQKPLHTWEKPPSVQMLSSGRPHGAVWPWPELQMFSPVVLGSANVLYGLSPDRHQCYLMYVFIKIFSFNSFFFQKDVSPKPGLTTE